MQKIKQKTKAEGIPRLVHKAAFFFNVANSFLIATTDSLRARRPGLFNDYSRLSTQLTHLFAHLMSIGAVTVGLIEWGL